MNEEEALKFADRYPLILGEDVVEEKLRKPPRNTKEAMSLFVRILYYAGYEIRKKREVKK